MDYSEKVFTLENGTRLLVVEQVDYKNRTYLLVVNSNNENDLRFYEIKDDQLILIDNELFKRKIQYLFLEKIRSHGGSDRKSQQEILITKLVNGEDENEKLTYRQKYILAISFALIVMTILFFYLLVICIFKYL